MILDTSVFYDVVVEGSRSSAARQFILETGALAAPDLIRIEMVGALTRAVRRNEITKEQARLGRDLSESLMPVTENSEIFVGRAFELSLELSHPCADCIFLAMAEHHNRPLATSDAKFARKLAGTPYARLVKLIEP